MKRNIIIISIAIILAVSYITINEINLRPKLNLIKDGEKIKSFIESQDLSVSKEIVFDNDLKIDNNKIKGYGVIFLENDYSFFLQRNGMCIMKMPYSDDIMFQDVECPEYRMIRQFKIPLAKSDDGLYFINNRYLFKGNNPDNYVEYNDDLYRIIELNDDYIIISSSSFNGDGNCKYYKDSVVDNKSFLVKNKSYDIVILKDLVYGGGKGTIDDPYVLK